MASVSEILHTIELADATLGMVDGALNNNPSVEEERALRRLLLRLEAERTMLEAELDAAMDDKSVAQGPSPEQLAEIVSLVEAVEAATNQRAAASSVITLATKSLGLVTDAVKA
jgi:hypothetical protein